MRKLVLDVPLSRVVVLLSLVRLESSGQQHKWMQLFVVVVLPWCGLVLRTVLVASYEILMTLRRLQHAIMLQG